MVTIITLLMVINQINIIGRPIIEPKNNPVVSGYVNAIKTAFIFPVKI